MLAGMKPIRLLLRVFLASALLAAPAAHAQEDAAMGHALTIVQMLVRAATHSGGDPLAAQKAMTDVLGGHNAEANRAFAGLFEEMTADMPAGQKDKMAAIGRDLASLARVEAARAPSLGAGSTDRALQARKDLTSMGLKYYDSAEYLAAVKRDDALAVELYLAGRGINPAAKDAGGRSALDIARANKNPQLAELIARNLPPAR
jgi:hypothetical protein